nr:MAG TPA: hypothetical protein [Caudoviricetes sp.]
MVGFTSAAVYQQFFVTHMGLTISNLFTLFFHINIF